jgi:hypothetical protein
MATTTPKPLFRGKIDVNDQLCYTAQTGETIILNFVNVVNTSNYFTNFSIYVVPDGQTAENKCYIIKDEALSPGGYFQNVTAIVLTAGDRLYVDSSDIDAIDVYLSGATIA